MKPSYLHLLVLFTAILLPGIWTIFILFQYHSALDLNSAVKVYQSPWLLSFKEFKSWYLLIDLSAFIFPFLLSFDKKVHFYKKWKFLFPAIFLVASFFIVWDISFTKNEVWTFNHKFTNFYLLDIPLGEWLFFFIVPYNCIFIYECLISYFPSFDPFKKFDSAITNLLIGGMLFVAIYHFENAYTFWSFGTSATILAWHKWTSTNRYRTIFYYCYLICLIPFTIVNGLLTGMFNLEPVVIYNNDHNLTETLGCRFFSIPYDDFSYGFLLIFSTLIIYEHLKHRSKPA